MPRHLDEIFQVTTTGAPAVNQFEMHVGMLGADVTVMQTCRQHNITVTVKALSLSFLL